MRKTPVDRASKPISAAPVVATEISHERLTLLSGTMRARWPSMMFRVATVAAGENARNSEVPLVASDQLECEHTPLRIRR